MTRAKIPPKRRAYRSVEQPEGINRLIGYARVSTADQSVEMQIDALRGAGVMDDNLHWEKVSGVRRDRPKLELALKQCIKGDTFVVYKLDRLARSMNDLLDKLRELDERGVALRSLTEGFDSATPGGRLLIHMLGALAQFERDLIVERTRDGVEAARARGVQIGGRRKMTPAAVKRAEKMLRGGKTVKEAAAALRVSPKSVYTHISRKLVRKWERQE